MLKSLIVAASSDGVIGYKNELPWNVPEDMLHFKQTTVGKPIIMGHNTFQSIGILPNRISIVVSSKTSQPSLGTSVIFVNSVEQAFKKAEECCRLYCLEECVVIGGENIYNQTIDLVDKVYYTEICKEIEGDAFFFFDKTNWNEIDRKTGISRNQSIPYIISTFEII